ncbi:MAG: hypothetical protein ACW96S_09960 [Promethearchaeota archaeon]|jgi:hypothetical protein
MDEKIMISGVRRKTTAEESALRFFQTVDLIISHFKREADKIKIFELTSQDTSFNDLLVATATIHIYHNLGIKVQGITDSNKFTFETTKNLEFEEKRIIMEEVNNLLKNSFSLEFNLLDKIIALENRFISFLIEERNVSLQTSQRENMLREIEDQIELELREIVLNYPPFYFYDLIGDVIGLTNVVKRNILKESSGLKEISIELEKKLELEEKEDKAIELATLDRLISIIRSDFEFKSYKELQVEAMPVRMIKKRIMDYNSDYFPISIPGLKAFKEANEIKKKLLFKIEESLQEKINYEQFELKLINFLKSILIQKLTENPNDFIYYLQCLNECSFDETIYSLNKYGVHDIFYLLNLNDELLEKVKKSMIRYNLKKLKNYAHILFVLEFEGIFNKLVKDIFFYIMSKILRQLSRIIELYFKVSNDRSLYLLALKKIFNASGSEEWVRIKLEELIIERLNKRQEELVTVLNASNDPFLVNGFIFARLTESSLTEGIATLKNEISPIYEDILPLRLKPDLMSPISYCFGYDIIKRLIKFEQAHKIRVEQTIEEKERLKEVQSEKLREKQELSTLNWIERRITSSLMRIKSPGINPNQLFWQEKDSKTATESIKLHSKLKGDPIILMAEFFIFAVEKINSFTPNVALPDNEKIMNIVNEISKKIPKRKLNKSEKEEIDLLDGERYEIASQIAQKIGKLLDKALYSKFKKK